MGFRPTDPLHDSSRKSTLETSWKSTSKKRLGVDFQRLLVIIQSTGCQFAACFTYSHDKIGGHFEKLTPVADGFSVPPM